MKNIIVSRRVFLKLAGAAAASCISIPAFTSPRLPYVEAGCVASFCGLDYGPGAASFCGGAIIAEVHDWDGIGYPVTVMNQAFGSHYGPMPWLFYDADLFVPVKRGELRGKMHDDWGKAYSANPGRYKNMASWVREQRFGETPEHYELRRRYIAREAA